MDKDDRYKWYEEDFTSFLLSLELPAYRKNKPLKNTLEDEKKEFSKRFNDMIAKRRFRTFSDEFYDAIKKTLPEIRKNCSLLIDTVEIYDNADMAGAQSLFDSLMGRLIDHLFINDIFWPWNPTRLYRIRSSSTKKLKEARELFHISYRDRHLVANERYSLAGHPCLYLASFLHIAWQECGYPHKFYYSEFRCKNDDNWKYITFLSPRKIASTWFVAINSPEEKYQKLAINYLLTYPLIFACSIVNLNGNSAFKQEYIIPQMLTQWVYRNNNIVKGIKYFSCYNSDETRYYNGYNVVLPATNYDNRGYSVDLIKEFKLSNPRCIECQLDESSSDVVHRYKEDLLRFKGHALRDMNDCINALYETVDLLDKAIRHCGDSDMNLIMSSVRNIVNQGKLLLEKYNAAAIVEKCKESPTYSKRYEELIKQFCELFNRFSSDAIEVAVRYNLMFDMLTLPKCEEFYEV